MGAAARGREERVEMESGGAIAWVCGCGGERRFAGGVAWRARRLVGRRRRREAPGAGLIRLSLSPGPSGAARGSCGVRPG